MECVLCNPKNENVIKNNDLYRVILVNEIPGFVRIILNKHIAEFSDLDIDEYMKIMQEIYRIEKIIKKTIKPEKINIASLGNYVPHLHIHIIPRFKDDSWFPDSIWSEKHRDYQYKITQKQIDEMVEIIKNG